MALPTCAPYRRGLAYPRSRLDGLLTAAAAAHCDRAAIITQTDAITYADLDAAASRWAATLRDLLSGKGIRGYGNAVAATSALAPAFAIAYYGTLRAGQVIAPVNPLLPGPQLVHQLGTVQASVAVVTAAVADRLRPLLARMPKPPAIVVMEELAGLLAGAPDGIEPAGVDPETVASVQFTSGTTGQPKAVELSHRNLVVNALQVADAHGLDGRAVTCNHLPTYHPMHLNSAVAAGATQALCGCEDPAESTRFAAATGATHYYSLPVRLQRLAADPRLGSLAMPTVRMIASGGSALPPAAARTLSAHFRIPVVQGYGLAETSPLTHSDPAGGPRPGSVGPPVADTDCRIVDVGTRLPVPPGEIGEVQVRGPQVMAGYRGEPVGSALECGWLPTGDVGRVDEDGWLYLVDRRGDVFKRDNWLVSPTAVERVLAAQPGVSDVCVVDVPDEFSGAVPHALLVCPQGTDVAAAVAAANAELAPFERVEGWTVLPVIPRSPNGKVRRADLRAVARASRSNDGEGTAMVTLVNKFVVSGDPAEFERIWEASSEFMRGQPGFISFHLVKSLNQPGVYINVAQWTDAAAHQRVLASPGFATHLAELATVATADPNLCETVIEHVAA